MDWVGIAIIALAGVLLVGAGWWLDQRNATPTRAPDREIPGLAEPDAPHYVTAADALAPRRQLPAPDAQEVQRVRDLGTKIELSVADARVLVAGHVLLQEPWVLSAHEGVGSYRELLALIQRCHAADRPVVLATTEIAAETAEFLSVNHVQGKFTIVPVIGDAAALDELADATGGAQVDRAQLQGGFLPDASLAECSAWLATTSGSWLDKTKL